jgi:hypothetical protein
MAVSRALAHAALALLLLLMALWQGGEGRYAIAALDAIVAAFNGLVAFAFFMATRRP